VKCVPLALPVRPSGTSDKTGGTHNLKLTDDKWFMSFQFSGPQGWLGLSPRSPGRGIEDSATATQAENQSLLGTRSVCDSVRFH
jgi:hypothetical protein